MFLTEKQAERFWVKVKIVNDEHSCWLWTASINEYGYGWFRFLGRSYLAHRVAYILKYGALPRGLGVLHQCDVPACVRPDHLRLGTQADNSRDMVNRGRGNTTKLNPALVAEIRGALASGERKASVARRYGVTRTSIYHIAVGRTWPED